MKKLSVLIALFMCVTIGGVYATWTYGGTDIADVFAEAKVTIADAEISGANGIYKIESNLVLVVEQANEEHEAKLVFQANDSNEIYLKVTFTPSSNAPAYVKADAVPSELYFSTTIPMQYRIDEDGNFDKTAEPVDIFKFSNTANGILDNTFEWTKQDNGTFIYAMNKADLEAAIQLNKTFVLDTKAEYDIFSGHAEYDPEGHPGVKEGLIGNIVARVTDGTVN